MEFALFLVEGGTSKGEGERGSGGERDEEGARESSI